MLRGGGGLAEKINICLRDECATNKQHPNAETPAVTGVTQPPSKHGNNNWQTYI